LKVGPHFENVQTLNVENICIKLVMWLKYIFYPTFLDSLSSLFLNNNNKMLQAKFIKIHKNCGTRSVIRGCSNVYETNNKMLYK